MPPDCFFKYGFRKIATFVVVEYRTDIDRKYATYSLKIICRSAASERNRYKNTVSKVTGIFPW